MKNKISIICSNYNSDRWIEEYFEYVNNQTLDNFDIIFIDVKSTDDSLNKIRKYDFRKGIRKTIIEYPERIGIYKTWNIAIKFSDTAYVMNYNTDDMLISEALSIYDSAIELNPESDIIYSPCGFVTTRDPKAFVALANWPEYSHETMLKYCICGPFPLLKKQSLEKAGYFNERFVSSGDYEMWLRMSKLGFNFKKVPQTLGSFYYRSDSIHSENSEIAKQEDLLIQSKYK